MERSCLEENHSKLPLTFICTNPNCTRSRLLCLKCLNSRHATCLGYLLEIDLIPNKNYLQNSNWIHDLEIEEAIANVEKHKLSQSTEQLFRIYEDKIEEEFTKLGEFFNQKLKEAKEYSIQRFKASLPSNVFFDQFISQLKSLYDFESFINILNASQEEHKDLNAISKELDTFLKGIWSHQQELTTLREIAGNINSATQDHLKINTHSAERFKISLDGILSNLKETFIKLPSAWVWDASQKSPRILLSQNNLKATKTSGGSGNSGILVNMKMSQGRHRWGIESTNAGNGGYICFGIIEPQHITALEPFSYSNAIYQVTNGTRRNLDSVKNLQDYENKMFVCDLDLSQGTFTVSHGGEVISEKKTGLNNKVFVPFAMIFSDQNAVKLHTID